MNRSSGGRTRWGGNLSQRNQNLYCTYHRDKGYTIEQCRVLKDHFGQIVKAEYLKEFVVEFGNRGARQGTQQKGNPLLPPLGMIEVIHATSKGTNAIEKRVLAVASVGDCTNDQPLMKKMKRCWEPIAFDDGDLTGMI